ncbi:MAG: MerC domain-containing protein [Planctomycetota bacterium]|nr:MerC domain-containing protein [Planctomycetota bacterium]
MQPPSSPGPSADSTTTPSRLTAALDRTGVIASVGCAIHCMIAPLLILVAPTLGGFWVHPVTHLLIAALVLPVASMALWRGFREHRRRWIVTVGGIGMALVIIGVILPWTTPPAHAAPAESTESTTCQACCPTVHRDEETGALALHIPPASVVTLLGGLALITAHIANLRATCGGCSRHRRREESAAEATATA